MKKVYAALLLLSAFSNAQIIDIPDANFKSVLLSSSPTSEVAGNAFDIYFAIDANGDGEIQVSEALEVRYLNMSETSIQNLTGIEFFENLETLFAFGCQLTSFDFSLPQLIHLDISDNALTSVTLQGCPSLVHFDCNYNNITHLNLDGLSNLESIFCRSNNLEVLDLGQTASLNMIDCHDNVLTQLDFIGAPNLQTIECTNNQLQALDISSNEFVEDLHCDNNEITYVNLKNGVNTTSFFSYSFFNNPIAYACVDPEEQAFIAGQFFSAAVSPYCTFTPGGSYNEVQGVVKLDIDTDGCDAEDLALTFLKLKITDGVTENYVFTSNGQYTFYTQEGDFIISPDIENPSLFSFSPASAAISFLQPDGLVSINDFCATTMGMYSDVEAFVAPIIPAMPGFNSTYQISYRNKGNQTVAGSIVLNYEESLMDFISTSFPGSQTPGTLTWDFENLQPFEYRTITAVFNINSPVEVPPVNIDDMLNFQGVLTINGAPDENPADNTFGFFQKVVGSYDPNDKICIEGDVVSPADIGDYLHYIINFENTGTAPAQNVVVRDVIDPSQFDISSLQLVSSSHPVVARQNGNVAEFIFENIQLDSGGHGNILLKIKTLTTLVVGDEVSNKADIYFDYNFPIETNDAVTRFESLKVGQYEGTLSLTFYPNPVTDHLTLKADEIIQHLELYDLQGRLLQSSNVDEMQIAIDMSKRQSGIYIVKATSAKGSSILKFIKN